MFRHLGIALWLGLALVQFFPMSAAPVAASGFLVYQEGGVASDFNFGSRATIGTNTSVYVLTNDYSMEYVMSHQSGSARQYGFGTGWGAGTALCGAVAGNSTAVAWVEPDSAGCAPVNPYGDNDYYNEYDGTYWCHGREGGCFRSRTNAQVGMYSSDEVILEGLVSSFNHGDQTTMGNLGQSQAIYLTNPAYKPTPTAPPSGWTALTSSDPNLSCGFVSFTRYNHNCGYAASVWYVYDWTTP